MPAARVTTSLPDVTSAPVVIAVAGRSLNSENADLQGEYCRIGIYHGRPAYRKPGTRTVIRYWSHADRWVIDREGLQESDLCNAYAEQGGRDHPAHDELVWRIWETVHKCHMCDPNFLVTAAPLLIQVTGRVVGRENSALNGEYRLVGLHQGKVAYQKAGTKHSIRYWSQDDRWLIDLHGLRDVDMCHAFAEAQGSLHPGNACLTWNVWDSDKMRHVPDPSMQAHFAPRVVELVGRDALKENAHMNGSYHLVGVHAGRPAYQKVDGTGHCIRYWPREKRWLIDLEGLGDLDVCNAFAEATGSAEHPGDSALVWQVWERCRAHHLKDTSVRTVVAPHSVRIGGRDACKENSTINGEYELVGLVSGKPAYKKLGNDHNIRYWEKEDRWLIDLEAGFDGGDVANAYCDAKGSGTPGNPELVWYVWESARGLHIVDDDVISEALWLPVADWTNVAQGGPSLGDLDGAFKGGC